MSAKRGKLTIEDFFLIQATVPDHTRTKAFYYHITEDHISGMVLSEIINWFDVYNKEGKPEKVLIDGQLWCRRWRADWWENLYISPRQTDAAITKLVEIGVITFKKLTSDGVKSGHIAVNWDVFFEHFERVIDNPPQNPYFSETQKKTRTKESITKNVSESKESITKNVSESPKLQKSQLHKTQVTMPLEGKSGKFFDPKNETKSPTPSDSIDSVLESDPSILESIHTVESKDSSITKDSTNKRDSNTNTESVDLIVCSREEESILRYNKTNQASEQKHIDHSRKLKGSHFCHRENETEVQSLFCYFWDYLVELTGMANPYPNVPMVMKQIEPLRDLKATFDEVVEAFKLWASGFYKWACDKGIAISFSILKFREKAEFQIQLVRRNRNNKSDIQKRLDESYEFAKSMGYE